MPTELEEGALALGATRWEMVRGVILPATRTRDRRGDHPRPRPRARRGDRRHAGDRRRDDRSRANIFGPADTLASKIAASYPGRGHRDRAVGPALPRGDPAGDRAAHQLRRPGDRAPFRSAPREPLMSAVTPADLAASEREAASPPSRQPGHGERRHACGAARRCGSRRRRRRRSRFARAPALSWDFFTKPPSLFGAGGGISSALIGSALIVGMATAMALPVGVLIAIYLTEFAPRRVAAGDPARARRPQRPADDHHGHLRLRPARDRARAERLCGRVRARDRDASTGRTSRAGGAAARAVRAA